MTKRTGNTNVTLRGRLGRIAFALIVCVCLLVTARNLYRRNLNTQLLAAVNADDLAPVRSLLDRGASLDSAQTDADGKNRRSALDMALARVGEKNDGSVACLLIERGALRDATPFTKSGYLEDACRNGSPALLRCLLEHGAAARSAIPGHDDALTYAVNYGLYSTHSPVGANYPMPAEQQAKNIGVSREMLDLLRRHGARVTPLMAVELEDDGLLRDSLAAGADVNARDQNGRTALHVAAGTGRVPLMQTLLAQGANVNAASFGTPLKMAAEEGHIDAVRLLLARGANVNLAGKYYASPLLAAVKAQHIDITRLLLAHHADPNHEPGSLYLQGTALSLAAGKLPAVVPDLLAHGADINGANGLALQSALRAHNTDMAQMLLRRGAKCYPATSRAVAATTYEGPAAPDAPHSLVIATPSTLTLAVTDAPNCFDMLMQAGADITPDKPDILLAAARAGRVTLFDRLIALGANVNAGDRQGKTPLTEAILHAQAGVQTLLDHGANPNVVTQPTQTSQHVITQPGQTPLILATRTDNAETVRLLLAHGAAINARPPQSHTALYYARQYGKLEMARLLEQAGAKSE